MRGELSALRVIGTNFFQIVHSVSQGNFSVFRKNSKEKIPETPGCSNHVRVPLWSTLLLCVAEFRLYLVMT